MLRSRFQSLSSAFNAFLVPPLSSNDKDVKKKKKKKRVSSNKDFRRKVLEIGVLIWSLATALVPVLAGFMPGLVLSRILTSFGSSPDPKFWLGICILHIWPFGDSLELLRRGHAKSSGGVNLLYIVLVGLIGILMGYFMRKS